MSGYREHEEALPAQSEWAQRIGIACLFVGAAVIFAYLGGAWGLIPKWIDSPMLGTIIVVMAGPLMASRRAAPSRFPGRRNLVIIAATLAVCAAAAAAVIYFKGA